MSDRKQYKRPKQKLKWRAAELLRIRREDRCSVLDDSDTDSTDYSEEEQDRTQQQLQLLEDQENARQQRRIKNKSNKDRRKNKVKVEEKVEVTKSKLRTSADVYKRIRWDGSGVESGKVMIGFLDRFLGITEIPFDEFQIGAEIPLHRVYYFRQESIMLWDRRTRVDLIFGSGETAINRSANCNHSQQQRIEFETVRQAAL